MDAGRLHICDTLLTAVQAAEIIFIAVPTPSQEDHSFYTQHVIDAIDAVAQAMETIQDYKLVVVISTVLPGTGRKEFLPILERRLGPVGNYGFAYNAQFIAMGTVVHDVFNPEFVLIGEADKRSGDLLERFYRDTLVAPIIKRMSIENAEVTKCVYNCYISQKIVLANTVMEMCEKIPNADCDVVTDALVSSTNRLLSPKYMRGGLGDGGSCHPRDSRALSYLAKQLNLSADPFAFVTQARYDQTEWIADAITKIVRSYHQHMPMKMLGFTFKPGTNLIDDSPAMLLTDYLVKRGFTLEFYDPAIYPTTFATETEPRFYVIGTAWPEFQDYSFVPGSIIIDPHGLLKQTSGWAPGCTLHSIGRKA
jgi:UDPglucose 6-dehydrogenase